MRLSILLIILEKNLNYKSYGVWMKYMVADILRENLKILEKKMGWERLRNFIGKLFYFED